MAKGSFPTEPEATIATKPIPDGYRTVTPYLSVDDAAGAIEYYTEGMAERAKAAMAAMSG